MSESPKLFGSLPSVEELAGSMEELSRETWRKQQRRDELQAEAVAAMHRVGRTVAAADVSAERRHSQQLAEQARAEAAAAQRHAQILFWTRLTFAAALLAIVATVAVAAL